MPQFLLIGGYNLAFSSERLLLIALFFLVAIGLTLFYYRRTNPPLEISRRLLLGFLRGVAFTALFFVFAEPLLVISKSETMRAVVALLIDNSSSMANNRNSAGQFEGMADYLAAVESRLDNNTEVVRYLLADTITVAGEIDGAAHATAIGDCLHYLAVELEEENLAGAVLFSDGVSNYGTNPATAAKALGAPVYTIGFGSPEPLPDISIVDVIYNPVGFADKDFEVAVVIESRGFEKSKLPLRIKHRGRILKQQSVGLVGEGRRQSAKLAFTPPAEGVYTFEISLPAQEKEQSAKNNSRQIQVKFRKSRIRILLAAACLNWDFKFIKQALVTKSDFDVDTYVLSNRRIAGTIPFPENIDALSEYDAVVLCDFLRTWLTSHKQLLDAFFARTGKGVFLIAGKNFASQQPTDYLAPLFPYQISDVRPVVQRETPLTLTEQGRIHPILQLSDDPAENERLLSSLPPFAGYLKTATVSAGSAILATAATPGLDGGEVPILGVHRYRTGKIALLTAFPFWKLDFLARGFDETDSSYTQIMENMILWLVARDDLERINLAPPQPIFVAGETIELTATILDESYLPVSDAEIEARLVCADRPQDTLIVGFQAGRPGRYTASVNYLPTGDYQVEGLVKRNGVVLGRPRTSLVVEPYSLEDLSPVSDFDVLKRISQVSGGLFYAADDTASLPPFPNYPPKSVSRRIELALFDSPIMLMLFIAAVCSEWYLRRKYQLL